MSKYDFVEIDKLRDLYNAIEDVIFDGGKDIKGLDYDKLNDMSAYLSKILDNQEQE